jgi:cell division septal protein FtsQ
MKTPRDPKREEIEQYQAYGEYDYAYRHPPEEQNRRGQNPDGVNGEPPAPPLSPREAAETARSHARLVTTRLIIVLAIMVAVIILLQSLVFRLTTVYVVGNVTKTPQQVATEAGLVKGLNMFSISEDEIRDNLNSDHTIVFKGLQKDYPNTIYLYISERQAVTCLQWLGLLYTVDAEGVVIDERNTTDLPQGMPSVIGLSISTIHVGQKIEVRSQAQMQAYLDIVSELELQEYRSQVKEMNLSDTDNLFIQLTDGISIRLGTGESMRAKIGAIRTDVPYLEQLGKAAGVLDVSTPEDAKYSPDN